jgi:hypothetical protein
MSGWIVAAVAVLTAAAAALAVTGRWAWHTLRRTQDFLDDWNGHPARAGVPERPGVMARLSGIEQIGGSLQDQMRLNGGSSLRDVVQQTAGDVKGLKQDVAALKDQIARK